MKRRVIRAQGPGGTRDAARSLAGKLAGKPPGSRALVVGLVGELGSGKTTFVKSFARALGARRRITSPTFLIMRRFPLPAGSRYSSIYHIDAYRVIEDELAALGLEEILKDPGNIVLVEWADKVRKSLPAETIWLQFNYGSEENERDITVN